MPTLDAPQISRDSRFAARKPGALPKAGREPFRGRRRESYRPVGLRILGNHMLS